MNYRRAYIPGGTYFLTMTTFQREPFLTSPLARQTLRAAIRSVRHERPFDIQAITLLPDHWHVIMTLPRNDSDFSSRIKNIKSRFTEHWLDNDGWEGHVSASKSREGRKGVWQPKFFEHVCRDEEDYAARVDYIHFNAVKHGYVSRPVDWQWCSFHRYVRDGVYPESWGCRTTNPPRDFSSLAINSGE